MSINFDNPSYNPPQPPEGELEPIAKRIIPPDDDEGTPDASGSDAFEFSDLKRPDLAGEPSMDDYNFVALRANQFGETHLNGEDILNARIYIQEHLEELRGELQQELEKGHTYVVISKEGSGLKYNLEFHVTDSPDKLRAYLRYNTAFDKGSSKVVSDVIDLFSLELLVKMKIIRARIKPTEKKINKEFARVASAAKQYKEARNSYLTEFKRKSKDDYSTFPETLQMVFDEIMHGFAVSSALQARHIALYEKEMTSMDGKTINLEKIAIYALKMDGPVRHKYFKNDLECFQATIGMVRNTADLHKEGFVHNDLKGSNFLWVRTMNGIETKMSDLGVASKLNSNINYDKSSCLPPEILRKKEKVEDMSEEMLIERNKAKDAWALGEAILRDVYGYAFWTRVNLHIKPETINESLGLMEKPQSEWDFPKHIPAEIQELIKGLLTADPDKRMTPEEAENYLKVILEA